MRLMPTHTWPHPRTDTRTHTHTLGHAAILWPHYIYVCAYYPYRMLNKEQVRWRVLECPGKCQASPMKLHSQNSQTQGELGYNE